MSKTTILSQIDTDELRELIAWRIEDTAEWRAAKAKQYPHDSRNKVAADRLNTIIASVCDISNTDLSKLGKICSAGDGDSNSYFSELFGNTLSETLRAVGFGFEARTAQQIVEALIVALPAR